MPTLQFLLPSRKKKFKKKKIPNVFEKISQKIYKISELQNLCLESYSLTS